MAETLANFDTPFRIATAVVHREGMWSASATIGFGRGGSNSRTQRGNAAIVSRNDTAQSD